MIVEHILEQLPQDKRLEYRNLLPHDCLGNSKAWPFFDGERLQRILTDEGLFVTTKLGSATLGGIRTKPLVTRALEIIETDMASWLSAEFLSWKETSIHNA